MQTLHAGCSKAEPKIFAPPQTPLPGAWNGQNLISWWRSLPLPTNPVWWGSMHAILCYHGNRPTTISKPLKIQIIIIITMYWRRASTQDGQVPGDATVRKRFFRNKFFIFHSRSKRIAFWNQWISLCVTVCKFSNFCGHMTTFRHPSGAYICQMPGHRLQCSKRHTFRVSAFHRCHWFGVKLFPVACA